MKYSIKNLKADFGTEEQCLSYLLTSRHGKECSCGGVYKPVKGRKQFQCSKCRFQIAPMAGTIFQKSPTPLTLWFHAIFVFSNAKSGISAKEMERQLGVTYKCAWRILTLIRKSLVQSTDKLQGDVETDQSYFGGRKNAGKNNEGLSQAVKAKSILMGAIQRGGAVRMRVVADATARAHGQFVSENIDPQGTRLMTDKSNRYNSVAKGYDRYMVDHHVGEYVRGDVYINTLDSFLAHVKRSIKGTHKVISKKHLQSYVDGFVWHYNKRHSDKERFASLLGAVLHGAR